jgi:hypothetical protein
MKYLATAFFLFFSAGLASAQIGINASYRYNNAPDWQFVAAAGGGEQRLLNDGYSIGLDYWLPLKAVRIDLVPELNFSRFRTTPLPFPALELDGSLTQNWYSFFLHANIYFLNLDGDCDCPTFSKSGGLLEKGLFLQLSPGISYLQQEAIAPERQESSQSWAPSLGAALGLDLGLSDFVTLSPMVGFRYFLPADWASARLLDALDTQTGSLKDERSDIRQVYVGLRLGVRFRT